MEYNSGRHLKILNAVTENDAIQGLIKERDNNPALFLKSVLCVAIQRISQTDAEYDIYRIIFNYQATHGTQIKDEDIYAIAHFNKHNQVSVAKFGIM